MGIPYATQLARFDVWAKRAMPILDAYLFVLSMKGGDPEIAPMTQEEAEEFGMLREAAQEKGNFGMGSADAATADRLGEAWVGPGARLATDGKTLVSRDGLRTYRPPSYKPKLGKTQANFERKVMARGRPVANGHLDIK
jgi:hypothetical protein